MRLSTAAKIVSISIYYAIFMLTSLPSFAADQDIPKAFESTPEEINEFTKKKADAKGFQFSEKFLENFISQAEQGERDNDTSAIILEEMGTSLSKDGKYKLAERALQTALSIRRRISKPSDPSIISAMIKLGRHYYLSGELELSETIFLQAEDFYEEHKYVNIATMDMELNLADVSNKLGKYQQAEKAVKSCQFVINVFKENSVKIDESYIARQIKTVADIHYATGKLEQAEKNYRSAIVIYESVVSMEPIAGPIVLTGTDELVLTISRLGRCLTDLFRYEEAERHILRSVGEANKHLSPRDPYTLEVISNLAYFLECKGDLNEAIEAQKTIFSRLNQIKEFPNADFAPVLNNLGRLYLQNGNPDLAEQAFNSALVVYRVSYGRENINYARALKNLAQVNIYLNQYEFARALLEAALEIAQKISLNDNNLFWEIYLEYISLYQRKGQLDKALEFSTELFQQVSSESRYTTDNAIKRLSFNSLCKHIDIIQRIAALNRQTDLSLIAGSFDAKKAIKMSGAMIEEEMRIKAAKLNNERITKIMREWRQVREEIMYTRAMLEVAQSRPAQRRNIDKEQSWQASHRRLQKREKELFDDLNEHMALAPSQIHDENFDLKKLQRLLHSNEAIISYLFTEKTGFMWILKSKEAYLIPLQIGQIELSKIIRELRRGLDQGDVTETEKIRPFNTRLAWQLYKFVFLPATGYLYGISKICVIPDGALEQFPLCALVAESPKSVGNEFNYRKVKWLVRDYAFTVYPSEEAFLRIRGETSFNPSKRPFIGFGDPVFTGVYGTEKKSFNRLPESTVELMAVAGALNVDAEQVITGKDASEKAVKQRALKDYRVIYFATHALLTEQAEKLGISFEPGILLSGERDLRSNDGYLTASEIAGLGLNANFVILSGCNTATKSIWGGTRGLLGLTRSFHLAGARAVVASHWTVFSHSTTSLMGEFFIKAKENQVFDYDKALQLASLDFIEGTEGVFFAHPTFWAPFVIIGNSERP